MHKYLIIILMLFSPIFPGHAQNAVPMIRILPEDVVQDSIHQYFTYGNTNNVMVRWQYTEAGAKKMLAFRNAHDGQKVIFKVGDFERRSMILSRKSYPPGWVNDNGWLKHPTENFSSVGEANAKVIIAGLKGK